MKRADRNRQLRDEALADLAAIPPLTPAARRLATIDGFLDCYFRLEPLFVTRREAYEALEEHYAAIFGHRRYAEWKAFRVVQSRYLRRHR